jgi:ADP-heptose:LPS heptosyltransferase
VKKILIIRFSSIGDIVLTEPLIRGIKKQYPHSHITFLTKEMYLSLLEFNPQIDKIICIKRKAGEAIDELKNLSFDLVLDLHKNYRSTFIKLSLGYKSNNLFKANMAKWKMVRLKSKDEIEHITLRYIKTAEAIGIKYDGEGLNFYLNPDTNIHNFNLPHNYIALASGGKYKTKCMPPELIAKIIDKTNLPVVVLGGREEEFIGEDIRKHTNKIFINLINKCSLAQSALIIKNADKVIANDTGLMHISAAYKKRMVVIWGNTTPRFGFFPFYPDDSKSLYKNFDVDLSCKPCSKLGFEICPKKHFNCMMQQPVNDIANWLNE